MPHIVSGQLKGNITEVHWPWGCILERTSPWLLADKPRSCPGPKRPALDGLPASRPARSDAVGSRALLTLWWWIFHATLTCAAHQRPRFCNYTSHTSVTTSVFTITRVKSHQRPRFCNYTSHASVTTSVFTITRHKSHHWPRFCNYTSHASVTRSVFTINRHKSHQRPRFCNYTSHTSVTTSVFIITRVKSHHRPRFCNYTSHASVTTSVFTITRGILLSKQISPV